MGELMETVWFILLAIGAYLLGSVPAAYLAIKWSRGTDIRKVGTGKVGAANVLNAGSKWLAVPVAIFDIGKGALVVFIAKQIGLSSALQAAVGLFAIVGHDWPLYLGFKSGGRGVFVTLGVITMISWKMGLIALIGPYLFFAPFKQVALGVFFVYATFPFLAYFFPGPLGVEDKVAIALGFAALSGIGLLVRIAVHRSELSKNVPTNRVILYRLLFDRDIADRKLWNSRGATSQG
jgi:acyl phosphate:glycerol-3-phosphate acyltransferase